MGENGEVSVGFILAFEFPLILFHLFPRYLALNSALTYKSLAAKFCSIWLTGS